jgi:hypothetical protein
MPRIELGNYGPIHELVVDGKPGFNPRGVALVMGVSGAGKTLLANALYMEPVLAIENLAMRLGLLMKHPALADAIGIAKTIADLYGFRNYYELHARSRFSVCVESGVAGDVLYSVGYDPGSIDYACLTSVGSNTTIELVTNGKHVEVKNPDMGLVSMLMLNTASIMSIPQQLRGWFYTLSYEEARGIYNTIRKVKSEVSDPTIGSWVDVLLRARVPPLIVGDLDFRSELGIDTVINHHLIDGKPTLMRSAGGLEVLLLLIARDFARALSKSTRDSPIKPLIYIDDALEHASTIDAKRLVDIMSGIVSNGASLVLTTYRPDVIALDDEDVKGFIDDYTTLYIATYGLEPLSKYGPVDERLWLVSVDELGEGDYEKVLRMLG